MRAALLAACLALGCASHAREDDAINLRRPRSLWDDANLALKSDDPAVKPAGEQYQFQADVNKLMDIIINSLYSKKEIFLRELISNGSDVRERLGHISLCHCRPLHRYRSVNAAALPFSTGARRPLCCRRSTRSASCR